MADPLVLVPYVFYPLPPPGLNRGIEWDTDERIGYTDEAIGLGLEMELVTNELGESGPA